MTNLVEVLARRASEQPAAPLYTFLDAAGRVVDSCSYEEFDARTTMLAAGLRQAGTLTGGEHVLLVYPPGLDFITAFFACVKLAAVPIPVPPPDGSGFIGALEKLAHIACDGTARVALTTEAFHAQMRRLAERSPEGNAWLQREPLSSLTWVESDRVAHDGPLPACAPNPLLFLQYTSGSTQQPRGVMVSHDNVVHNAWATLQHRPVGVSWLPHYHDMGLIGYYLFIAITGGSMYGFSAASFLKRPLLWLETITRYRGTISSAPNFAFEYCLREDKVPDAKLATLDLSSMVCMMNASEPVRAATYERFQARFGGCGLSPGAHMVFYGLAENTLSVTGNGRVAVTVNSSLLEQNQLKIEASRADGFNQTRVMSCGRPLAGVDIRIVAPGEKTALADQMIGEVWVGGPSKAAGYLGNAVLSESHFAATLEGTPGAATYLRTGDVGFLHDGELFLCGRLKDMMIVGGRNYYPADLEAVVEAASSKVRSGCVVAFAVDKGSDGEGIAVIAEARRGNDLPDLAAICREIRKRCQVDVDVMAIVPHGTVTKTSSGKIARQLCRRRWELGEIRVIASRQRPARAGVNDALEQLLHRFDFDGYEERTLADLGIDSLTLVDLSLHLEGVFAATGQADGRPAAEAWSDLRVLQAITVGELRSFAAALSTGVEVPEIAPDLLEARLETIDRDELARMKGDARLPPDIVPRPARVDDDATVLLTGATGFLGAFLLESLLRLTRYQVVVLVRAGNAEHARARAESALERTGLFDAQLRAAFAARVRAVAGDLAEPQLGLPADGWASLSAELSAIYHCGADVDYVKPYETLRAANVSSTVEIVRLACSGRAKALHYASTTFMFGFVAREVCLESDANLEMAGLNFGYAQTKWVAEQLVLDAAARGLTARVYRPSLITASRQGKYVRRDLMSRILSYMIRHGVAVNSTNQISFVPVDVCANNIIALSLNGAATPAVVHITADRYYTMPDVCAAITRHGGYPFDYVSLERFMEYMNAHCPKNDPMFPLLAFFNQNWRRIDSMRNKRYDSAQYRQARAAAAAAVEEPLLDQTVGQIVAFLQAEDLVSGSAAATVSKV